VVFFSCGFFALNADHSGRRSRQTLKSTGRDSERLDLDSSRGRSPRSMKDINPARCGDRADKRADRQNGDYL
jgi:hypothetical protein